MEENVRIFLKLAAVVALTLLFVWLIYTDKRVLQLEQPEGELIKARDVWILLGELREAGEGVDGAALDGIQAASHGAAGEYLSYGAYMELLDVLLGGAEQSYEKEKITYKHKYRKDFFLLKSDWYNSYALLLEHFGLEDVIREEVIQILGGNGLAVGEKEIGEGCLLGKDGEIYPWVSGDFSGLRYTSLKAYVREGRLLTLVAILPDKSRLENVWIMEDDESGLRFFYRGYELSGEYENGSDTAGTMREQVGDLCFEEGSIVDVEIKPERISGKLLGISEGQVEIEGHGRIALGEDPVGYRLYEKMDMAQLSDLAIGYDFTDFVLEDGKVCAFLIARKEKMETIRVALKNSGYGSIYHDRIILSCQEGATVFYGDFGERKQVQISPGQEITVEPGSEYLSGDRMEIVPDINTARIQIHSLNRSQGSPFYRGSMEIVNAPEGLVLINEVLLEEYLYSVVPSEMPASYPIEALKAQAICARTYGYRYLKQPGYAALGAHVDDSVGYQVYNNIAENVNSTRAVKETAGMLLFYDGEPVNTYYYSTSCGFGADAGVWNEEQKEQMPYLNSIHIARERKTQELEEQTTGDQVREKGIYTPAELTAEENFRAYISGTDEDAYEGDEPWFRWEYQISEIDIPTLNQRMQERFLAVPGKILTLRGDDCEDADSYEAAEPRGFKEVYEIRPLVRKEGGILDELLIETDKGTYKVISEYNIRYILCQGGEVTRQDGSVYESSTLLPSAYFVIDTVKNKKNVVGYTISGGGYGHGVGMSQNGARAMGMEERDAEGILSFYFRDCRIDKIY